jgi:hypothetical protein
MSETLKKIGKRYEANCEIINKLLAVATAHPDWRFHQLLQNCRVDLPDTVHNMTTGDLRMLDLWGEESVDTLVRVRETYDKFVLNQANESKPKQAETTVGGGGLPQRSGL